MLLMALAPAPVGNAQRFPAAGRGGRVSCGQGGGAPLSIGKSAPEQGPTQGGLGGDQAVVDSASLGILAFAASARKLGPVSSRMTQWWMSRSMAAAVVMGSLKILSHWENTKFEVMMASYCVSDGTPFRP